MRVERSDWVYHKLLKAFPRIPNSVNQHSYVCTICYLTVFAVGGDGEKWLIR